MFVTPGYAQEAAPAEGEAHTEAGALHEPEGLFPPFDSSTYASQLLWLAITFGLFYLFLKRVVLPQIGNILEIRRDRIAQDLDQAASMKAEADAALAAYEQELAEAKGKANAIGQEARDSAKAEVDAERRKIESELEQKLTDAEKRIAEIKDSAMREVSGIAEDVASAIVQELLGANAVDKAAVSAAVKTVRA